MRSCDSFPYACFCATIDTKLTHEDVKVLSLALKGNKKLFQLSLVNNYITADGASVIARAITESNLNFLSLCIPNTNVASNPILNEGAEALAETLKVNRRLQRLILGRGGVSVVHCGIGNLGAVALAKALGVNAALVFLNLGMA